MESSKPEKVKDEMDKCPECNGRIVRERDMSERYCEECGYIPEETIFADGTGEHGYDSDGQPIRRTRRTYMRHDKGLSTRIGGRKGDYKGVKPSEARKLSRMHWQTLIMKDMTFKEALEKLDTYGSKIGIPNSMREEAAYYLWEVRGSLSRGRSYDEIIGGIYKILCDHHHIPRSIDRVSEKCNSTRKKVGKVVRVLKKNIDDFRGIMAPGADEYVSWLCSELKLSIDCETMARRIIEKGKEGGVGNGRGPVGVAATAIYRSCNINNEIRSQREIAKVADVTEVTIRNISKLYDTVIDWEEIVREGGI